MKTMQDYRYAHTGETCFIVARGPSLLSHDLSRLRTTYGAFPKVMGLNNSYLAAPCHYVVLAEMGWLDRPESKEYFDDRYRMDTTFLVGAPPYEHRGVSVPAYCHPDVVPPPEPISLSPSFGAVLGWGNVGSVAYAALQIAIWMGFHTINFLGLDLGGGVHFDGTAATADMAPMNQLFVTGAAYLRKHRPELQVFNVGSPESRCTAFPHRTFDEAMSAAAGLPIPKETVK